jgi:hypothetical protein
LGLYKWALEQRSQGRYIVSMNHDLSDPVRLLMPSVEEVAPRGQSEVAAQGRPMITKLAAAD